MKIRHFLVLVLSVGMLNGCAKHLSYAGITKDGEGKYRIATVETYLPGVPGANTNGTLACRSKPNGDLTCKKHNEQ